MRELNTKLQELAYWLKITDVSFSVNSSVNSCLPNYFQCFTHFLSMPLSLGIHGELVPGGLSVNTKIHRCSSPIYKMALYLHINLHICTYCIYFSCLIQPYQPYKPLSQTTCHFSKDLRYYVLVERRHFMIPPGIPSRDCT